MATLRAAAKKTGWSRVYAAQLYLLTEPRSDTPQNVARGAADLLKAPYKRWGRGWLAVLSWGSQEPRARELKTITNNPDIIFFHPKANLAGFVLNALYRSMARSPRGASTAVAVLAATRNAAAVNGLGVLFVTAEGHFTGAVDLMFSLGAGKKHVPVGIVRLLEAIGSRAVRVSSVCSCQLSKF